MFDRMRFDFTVADGGASVGDTGHMSGLVHQLRYYPDTLDTGQSADLSLAIVPGAGDTGKGFDIWAESALDVGAGFTRLLRDTGYAAVHGDRLRLKVVPTDTGVAFAGKLWVWAKRD